MLRRKFQEVMDVRVLFTSNLVVTELALVLIIINRLYVHAHGERRLISIRCQGHARVVQF